MKKGASQPIYLDYNATTPTDPKVQKIMEPYFCEKFGNASSSSHSYGWEASAAVSQARKHVASSISARPEDIYFTSGATESNNMALKGVCYKVLCPSTGSKQKPHVITTSVEHKCVHEVLSYLENWGVEVTYLPVDEHGICSVESIKNAIKSNTKLISIIFANNEIGTINPIHEIGALSKKHNILFHTDAAQACGKIDIDVDSMGIDLLSISAHKIYGPKGVGALYVRGKNPEVNLTPLQHGGSQEAGLRPGTLNVPGIVGLGAALEIAMTQKQEDRAHIKKLRETLLNAILPLSPSIKLNGHPTSRLCNNISLTFSDIQPGQFACDLSGIAFSSNSACSSDSTAPSYVLKAIGLSDQLARSTIRLGLGRFTTEDEINTVIQKLKGLLKKADISASY